METKIIYKDEYSYLEYLMDIRDVTKDNWTNMINQMRTVIDYGNQLLLKDRYFSGLNIFISETNLYQCWTKYDEPKPVFDGTPYYLYGDYWISNSGQHMFRPKTKKANHILIRCDWDVSGSEFAELKTKAVYIRRIKFKDEKGVNYYVFNKEYFEYMKDKIGEH